ncbi:hypothetical protein [Phenylobacterium sp.]|uniref:hypothetical protein n=1 Tax=Phenylobacterium sp. TaxID=1871053 RepID=UPI002C84C6A2|nr:hypothetical protein [Phenylobacterium sp.]HLZ76111.1 hypothetical protein [Phenylobacterium sp.]
MLRARRVMVSSVNNSYLLGLFSTTNSADSHGIISMDLSSLIAPSSSSSDSSTPSKPVAPTPPWNSSETADQSNSNVTAALSGQAIINEGAAQLDLPGASTDYRKLFTMYQGLSTLMDLANAASGGISPQYQAQLSKAFDSGLSQLSQYIDTSSLSGLRVTQGTTATSDTATLAINKPTSSYITPPLTNSLTADVPAFDGNVVFNIGVTLNKVTTNVPIDLSNLGAQPRSLANVIGYINSQLAAAGVQTRVATNRIPGQAQTITAGGTTVTLPPTSDQWALKINVGTSETVNFSAPQTAGAVYVGQTVGNPDPDNNPATSDSDTRDQLVKFQTDTANVAAPPQIPGQANFTPGRVFAENLDTGVGTIHAMQTGADGSVYMLADVSGSVEGQSVQGTQDVALLKYDSAGHLIYTRTLGASDSASGLGLAVSSTGQVAVVGQVTGTLNGATNGALNSNETGEADQTDSFTTLYDASGNEVWTDRRGATLQDQANQVTFSADGSTVYVAGQSQSSMPGSSVNPQGGYDGYIEALQTSATGTPHAVFTQSYGTAGQDTPKGLAVDGNTLFTASVESGHAVLRSFDISSGTPVLSNTRDLGDLQGGSISGLAVNNGQLVVAGTTSNPALSAGTVTLAASGGSDAFAAQVDESLNPTAGDAIAYYGGTGNDRATALSVSNGQVWIGGQAGTDLPGQAPVGTKDGFLAELDIANGTILNSQRFTGKDGMAAPTAIAVDTTGSSILDRLGLPKGNLTFDTSQQLSSQSTLRAGEQFVVGGLTGPGVTVTIDPGETLQTLATKIQRASGSQLTATVVNTGTQSQLKLTPAFGSSLVTLTGGPGDKNALPTLGLPEGLISGTVTVGSTTSPADGGTQIFGLGLASTLNIDNAAQLSHAKAVVASAQGVIRKAYQALVTAATPVNPAQASAAANGGTGGTVPQYLSNELANLQAGLARLTGGNSAPSTSTFA